MSMVTKVLEDTIRIASVSPNANVMFMGEILTEKGKYSEDCLSLMHYGDCVSFFGMEDIVALRDFLNELIDLREKTPVLERVKTQNV